MSAIRILFSVVESSPTVVSPRRIAEELGESPTYLSKVATLLVKANILRAEKGSKGGVRLARPIADVTLLQVVEACQGSVVGNYCSAECDPRRTCSFHRAAKQLEKAVSEVLAAWTLEALMQTPQATRLLPGGFACVMLGPAKQAELIESGTK